MSLRYLLSALAVAALALGLPGGAGASEFKIGSTMFFSTDTPQLPVCLTNYQVRQAVEGAGYGQVKLNVPNGDHIQVKASQGAGTYLIDFNRCTGLIESVQALR